MARFGTVRFGTTRFNEVTAQILRDLVTFLVPESSLKVTDDRMVWDSTIEESNPLWESTIKTAMTEAVIGGK